MHYIRFYTWKKIKFVVKQIWSYLQVSTIVTKFCSFTLIHFEKHSLRNTHLPFVFNSLSIRSLWNGTFRNLEELCWIRCEWILKLRNHSRSFSSASYETGWCLLHTFILLPDNLFPLEQSPLMKLHLTFVHSITIVLKRLVIVSLSRNEVEHFSFVYKIFFKQTEWAFYLFFIECLAMAGRKCDSITLTNTLLVMSIGSNSTSCWLVLPHNGFKWND